MCVILNLVEKEQYDLKTVDYVNPLVMQGPFLLSSFSVLFTAITTKACSVAPQPFDLLLYFDTLWPFRMQAN